MEDGCGFVWAPGKNPVFRSPDGSVVVLDLHYNVPYISEKQASCLARHLAAVPAGGSSSSSGKKGPEEIQDPKAAGKDQAVFRRAQRRPPDH